MATLSIDTSGKNIKPLLWIKRVDGVGGKFSDLTIFTFHEVSVCYEDQMRINLFARKNIHLCELKEQVEEKEKELQNIKDALDELILADEDDATPFLVGEVFIHMGQEKVNEALEKSAEKLEEETASVRKEIGDIEKLLSDLKVQLYAKFGDNINLESD